MLKSYINNRNINFINFHGAIHVFAEQMGYIFMGVYLYEVGIPLWIIFLTWASGMIFRAFLRPISMHFCFKLGIRNTLFIGTLLFSTIFPILAQVQGLDFWLFLFIVTFAFIDVFYWLPYHTFFVLHGENNNRGKHISLRAVLNNLAELAAPISSGLMISTFGYGSAFWTSSLIMLVSMIPLYFCGNIKIKEKMTYKQAKKDVSKKGFCCYLGYGFYYNHDLAWKLILFMLVLDTAAFGGLLSLAILFQIILSLLMGRLFDDGNGKRLFIIGLVIMATALIGRAFFVYSVWEVILFDLVFMFGHTFYDTPLEASIYNMAKESRHPLWFNYFAELGWDVGAGLSALISALILYFEPNALREVLFMSILGLPIIYSAMRKYLDGYAKA